jgi:hypothetical protein
MFLLPSLDLNPCIGIGQLPYLSFERSSKRKLRQQVQTKREIKAPTVLT